MGNAKMADIQGKRQTRKFKNYMSAFVTTYKAGIALENFTKQGLQALHTHVKQILGHLPQCQHQCSRLLRDTNTWCVTCIRWKNELEVFLPQRNFHKFQWHDKRSWLWPNGADEIAEVFLLPGWDNNNINLQDISTIFNIWNRCSQFPRQLVKVLQPLKDCRNELIHGVQNMKLTNAKTKVVFQNIFNVMNHPGIRPSIPNHAEAIQTIRDLKKGQLFRDDIVYSLKAISIETATIKTVVRQLENEIVETNNTVKMLVPSFNRLARLTLCNTVLIVLTLSMLLGLRQQFLPVCMSIGDAQPASGFSFMHKQDRLSSTEGCLSESFDRNYMGRVSLFEYISHHRVLVGREWLIKEVDKKLISSDLKYNGILLEAGMGYGKSALLKHIICANNQSSAYRLRSHLIAYHICRYDVFVSKQAFIFVIRLMNMISSQMPILADEINSCKEIFDRKMCENDPHGCLDQCILIPLKHLKTYVGEPVIIVIDALDECYDKYRRVNEIFSLLNQRLYLFPDWVKFLISSRPNQPKLKQLTTNLLRLELLDKSEQNKDDIDIFLQRSNYQSSFIEYHHFRKSNLSNFQLVTLIFTESTKFDETLSELSLDRYYEEQFNRLFSSDQYEEPKTILEVMCTTFQPTNKDNIWNVLSNTTGISVKQFEKYMNSLQNFFRIINGEFYFIHQSFQHWLLDVDNDDFSIDIENGHRMNAMYMFTLIENSVFDVDVADLAIHAGLSDEPNLQQKFTSLDQITKLEILSDVSPIIKLAQKIDNFIAMDILASHFRNVDRRDENNRTALYIAASLGHVKTFEALIKWNANITFRTDTYKNIIHFEDALKVSIEHMFWDYGILDIAAQNGRVNIVDFILKKDTISFTYPMSMVNSMKLLPIHLACKKGHLSVVKELHMRHRWMLDWQCLYYASEIGHVEMVAYILENNIRDQCRPCNTYIHWLPEGYLRIQGRVLHSKKKDDGYVLFDDWNRITCESALHVAVRENKLETVKLLVKQKENAIGCFDRGGKTPVLSAVLNDVRDIVEFFLEAKFLRGNETCSGGHRLTDILKLHENEEFQLERYFCEANMSLGHIVAKYGRIWVVDMMLSYEAVIDWDIRDSVGCYPFHTAACHGSLHVLTKLIELSHDDFKFYECHNGSNPLHSAIACGSVTATEILLLNYKGYEIESKLVKMTYINHAIVRDNGVVLARNIAELENDTAIIMSMLVTDDSDLKINDEAKRNIMHHVVQNGHFYVASFLVLHYPETVEILMKSADHHGRNPLKYALHRLQTISQFHIPPIIYDNDVLAVPLDRMDAKEYSLLLTINFKIQSSKRRIDERLMQQLVKRQCLNIIVFLLKHFDSPSVERNTLVSILLEHDRFGLQMLSYLTSPLHELKVRTFFGNNVPTNCDELTNKYHLHLIALKFSKVSTILSIIHLEHLSELFLKLYFHNVTSSLMRTCYDKDGFNVLERAIQGGCARLVRHLIASGVRSDINKETLVQMALDGIQYRGEDEYISYVDISSAGFYHITFVKHKKISAQFASNISNTAKASILIGLRVSQEDIIFGGIALKQHNSDLLISELLRVFHRDIRKSAICTPEIRQFSIIHRLAFDGHLSSIKLAVKYWGKEILLCRNDDGFTPLYMSKVLKCDLTTEFIQQQGVQLQLPQKRAETYLFFKIRFNYFFSRNEHKQIQCMFSYYNSVPNTLYDKIKSYVCARKVLKVLREKHLLENLNIIKWRLAFLIELDTWNQIMDYILIKAGIISNIRYSDLSDIEKIYAGKLFYMFTLNIEKANKAVVSQKDLKLFQLIDAQSRVCNYMRIPFKKYLEEIQSDIKDCEHINCFLKDDILSEIKDILACIDLYSWNVNNCTYITLGRVCVERRLSFKSIRYTRDTFKLLNLELLNMAAKEAIYLPVFKGSVEFDRILRNPSLWLRMMPRFNYIDSLQTSIIYRGSPFHKRKLLEMKSHITGVQNTLKFIEWNQNAVELLEKYLETM